MSPSLVWTPTVLPVTSITNHPATHLLAMYTSTGWPCLSLVAVLAFDLCCLGFAIGLLPLRRELQIRNSLRLSAREREKIIGPVEIATTKWTSGEGWRALGQDSETGRGTFFLRREYEQEFSAAGGCARCVSPVSPSEYAGTCVGVVRCVATH